MASKALLDPANPDPNPQGEPDPNAADPANPDPNAEPDPNAAQVGERPDYIPEDAWDADKGYDPDKHFDAIRATRRPETADAYELPDIEGFDKEQAANSPIVGAFRAIAHRSGLNQDEFNEGLKEYVAEAERLATETADAELKKLGDNAKQRVASINTSLGGLLAADHAKALAGVATSADVVAAIEALIAKAGGGRQNGGTGGGGGSPTTRKTRAEIETMMNSPAYSGKPNQRDPKVVEEVDTWFQEEARLNPRKK